ncbi:uncharacterized protein LOC115964730 [Quercus lobata]|uniref:uncharacterized protein LOC115964730 n=1 Tax=Quercus lobata TaxID=97700 RepID=UPI0012448A28|nr:uncharacterized protein LOC115964730 [Quercus lobata]
MNLPTVQAPIHKRPLLLYLATNSYAIGGLIAQEDGGGVEQPIYYISHALKDAETRYLRAERAYLTIVYASQRLCHYFLAYEVWLLTKSHAIKALLQQPILSGEEEFSLDDEVPGEVAMAEEVREQWVMKFDWSSTIHSGGV